MLYFAVHYKKKMFHKCASDLSSGSCHVLIMILLIVSLIVMYCHVFIRMLLMMLFQAEANKRLELKNISCIFFIIFLFTTQSCQTMVEFCFLTLNKVKFTTFGYLYYFKTAQTIKLYGISHKDMEQISIFVILLYDRSSLTTSVNECRWVLFTQKKRWIEGIPLTEDSLVQNMKRAMLQSQ